VHGERTGYNDTDWDMRFIDLIEHDPLTLARMRHIDYVRLGGAESVEMIMWLAMRGALSDDITKKHQNYYLATTTAMTVMVLEENAADVAPVVAAPAIANPQLEGIEEITGTYPFDVRVAGEKIKLNRFFWRMKEPAFRQAFQDNEAAACQEAGLTEAETTLVRERDWIGLIRNGANFFVLEKFARVVGESNLAVYAEMRGESFADFMATRRVPEAQ
jgi:gallate dioxygenase